jgi:hypothetical protein
MPVLDTVNDYVSDARTLLQDTLAPFRYADPDLVTALNVTLLEASRLRPDLFLGRTKQANLLQGFTVTDNTNTPSTQVDMELPFRLGIVHGVCAHALMRDQEDVQDARASAFLNIFNIILVGKVNPGIPQRSKQQ